MCIAVCTIIAHNIAQNIPDNFPSYPPDKLAVGTLVHHGKAIPNLCITEHSQRWHGQSHVTFSNFAALDLSSKQVELCTSNFAQGLRKVSASQSMSNHYQRAYDQEHMTLLVS